MEYIKRPGFTLIEIMIALFIVGMALALILPQFQRARPGADRDDFINNVRSLVTLAWQQALLSHKIHRILFSLQDRTVRIEKEQEKDGKTTWVPLKGLIVPTNVKWSKNLEIRQFLIEGSDQLSRFGPGKQVTEVYFFIMPDGMTQPVTINLIDKSGGRGQRPQTFSMILNPFSAQFKVEYA